MLLWLALLFPNSFHFPGYIKNTSPGRIFISLTYLYNVPELWLPCLLLPPCCIQQSSSMEHDNDNRERIENQYSWNILWLMLIMWRNISHNKILNKYWNVYRFLRQMLEFTAISTQSKFPTLLTCMPASVSLLLHYTTRPNSARSAYHYVFNFFILK